MSTKPFNGRHMAGILVAFFGVVIAVNVLMARLAIGTFGGEVVENSYVASQQFNRWLTEAASERSLGWEARATREPDGRLLVHLLHIPAGAVSLTAIARHPVGRLPDSSLQFRPIGNNDYLSVSALPPGRWHVRLEVRANGRQWRREGDVQ